ncbi:MAG: sugar phosphate nucleotidyltransferase, partial [Thermoanaerobaculales bacterium]|nr:sugar phosphate nucleotidyltransferase [Thermoanaerobaculales bacterium]
MTAIAMVLAAGRGERMRPLSAVLPKPALPLLEQPVIASAINLAAAADCRRIVVNAWHLTKLLERSLEEIDTSTPVAVSREPELMGTAGGLALARERGLLGDDGPVLVINGDGLLNLDLKPLFERMANSGDLISLALLPHLDPKRWSRIVLEADQSVAKIIAAGDPKPGEVTFLYPGVMLVSRQTLDSIDLRPGGVPEQLWGPALAARKLGGVPVSGHWREIGTPSAYLEAVMGRL